MADGWSVPAPGSPGAPGSDLTAARALRNAVLRNSKKRRDVPRRKRDERSGDVRDRAPPGRESALETHFGARAAARLTLKAVTTTVSGGARGRFGGHHGRCAPDASAEARVCLIVPRV